MNKYYSYKLKHKGDNMIYIDGFIYAENEIQAYLKLIDKIKDIATDFMNDEIIIIEKYPLNK